MWSLPHCLWAPSSPSSFPSPHATAPIMWPEKEAYACSTYTEHHTHGPQAKASAQENQTKENKERDAEHMTSLAEPLTALAFVSEASI